ncbi:Domain of unknown function (DUF1993) [Seminavis robusta]|uniref:DUF1993 domain-containing protein n=1 Tax=Seminavis robusta TaxID=568900 RepID=A0A9N8DXE6_9STRA|nr:Domain of unknown function (DUF1993) [Seminavis robusta]|eukprot:Sro448_g145230.1 Domain of unknown function (DUF1993) (215) ;mRNA; r:56687-57331
MSAMSSSVSLTALLVPAYKQMLKHLSAWLEKTGDDPNEMLARRLAPDMFPLDTQVRFACFQAQEAVFRLQGKQVPQVILDIAQEGRNNAESPGTVEEAKARIQEALAFLEALDEDALDSCALQKVTLELPDGLIFDMTGFQYVRDWAQPQFYFHLMTAYSILRKMLESIWEKQTMCLTCLPMLGHQLDPVRTNKVAIQFAEAVRFLLAFCFSPA